MTLKEILETGIELSKVLNILRPSAEYEDDNRHFLAWYVLAATTIGPELDAGIAHKIFQKYLEARVTPLPSLKREVIQEMMDSISDQGWAERYTIPGDGPHPLNGA